MTEQELQEFKARVQYALFHKFKVGKASEYAEELAEEGASMTPPKGVKALSAAHLLLMIEQVEAAHGGSKPTPKPAAKPAPAPAPKPATKSETKPPPKPKAAAVEVKAEVKVESQMRSEAATMPGPKDEDRPTVPVDISAVHAAVQSMKAQSTWEVVVTDMGNSRIALVKELRDVLDSDLRTVDLLVDKLPAVLKSGMPQAEAEGLMKRLQATGATIEVRQA